jgi:heme/copper-type cytochrome/quinol oxidase subunit 3
MRTRSLIAISVVIAAMLPASAQAEPHTKIALRALYWHHLNFVFIVPAFFSLNTAKPTRTYGSGRRTTAARVW